MSLDTSPPASHAVHTHGTRVDGSTMETTTAVYFDAAVKVTRDRLALLSLYRGDSDAGDSFLLCGNVFGGMMESTR